MKELANLPQSVRTQLEKAQGMLVQANTLAQQGQPQLAGQYASHAGSMVQSALNELVRQRPELGAAVMALQMGYNQFTVIDSHEETRTTRTPITVLGMKLGESVSTTTTKSVRQRTIRFEKY